MKYMEMTSPQLAIVDRDQTMVLQPIAALEQHGPHMPTGTDTIICGDIAAAVERQMPEKVLLLPTLWQGASAHHLRFGATISADLDGYINTLCNIGECLLDDGYQRIMYLNGHGGNVDPLKVALRNMQLLYPEAILSGGSYWSIAEQVIADNLEGEFKTVGHADEFETSMVMHLRPGIVDEEKREHAGPWLPDVVEGLFVSRDMKQRTQAGCTGRPDLASSEKGATMFTGIVERICQAIEKLLAEPIPE